MRRALQQFAIAVALFLSGCGPSNQAFDRTAVPTAKAVVVLPAGYPASFSSFDLSWGLLGITGDLIGQDTVHTNATATADAADEFTKELEKALRASGWTVQQGSPLVRPKQNGLVENYGAIANSSNAVVLDSAITDAGYIAGVLRAFRPQVFVSARLVDPASGKILYAQRFIYGVNPLAGPVTFVGDADDRYYFWSAADLRAHPDEAVAGLRAGFVRIADTIAADLESP